MHALVIAHAGHWLVNLLYAAPMVIIGGVLWWTSRKERLASDHGPAEEYWEGQDDPQWNDPADDDRLR